MTISGAAETRDKVKDLEPCLKDETLDAMSTIGNVAQFISFAPESMKQRFCRIRGYKENHKFPSVKKGFEALLNASDDKSINVRSFLADKPDGNPFKYGINDVLVAEEFARKLSRDGYYVIVNETIDVEDGGVSGVVFGDVVEFAPMDTPRCVEKPGTAELSMHMMEKMVKTVYGFKFELPARESARIEFSVHPLRRGFRRQHVILWQHETVQMNAMSVQPKWPNRFSRHIGDKAFGLLMAYLGGLRVPKTRVIPRRLAEFSFGTSTGLSEVWIRTCPTEQVPGKYPTQRGWSDPFRLMSENDPDGTALASLLVQNGVEAIYSGALITEADGKVVIEGVKGSGEAFMQGIVNPEDLPKAVREAVKKLYSQAKRRLGPVRMEWVFDGKKAWVVQLHVGKSESVGDTIYAGEAREWRTVKIDQKTPMERLTLIRELIEEVQGKGIGLTVEGGFGKTSHVCDALRKAKVPSVLKRT